MVTGAMSPPILDPLNLIAFYLVRLNFLGDLGFYILLFYDYICVYIYIYMPNPCHFGRVLPGLLLKKGFYV